MEEWALAIDFGTSYTTAAMASRGQSTSLEIHNSRYLPCLVAVGDNGQLLTGAEALQLASQRPERAERLPKRALVEQDWVLLGGQDVATTDLVAAVLGRVVVESARFHDGRPPATVILTHPAVWGDEHLGRLAKAAATAGLAQPRFLPEPVAAALYYAAKHDLTRGAHLAVYDLGGGTFDTAVVRREDAGFVVVGRPGGDPNFGGEDLNEMLLELLGERARERNPGPWYALWKSTERDTARSRTALRREINIAKEALSTTPSVVLGIPGYNAEFLLRRHEYEAHIDERLNSSIDHLAVTVASAGITVSDLDAVVLAGGASRTPRVSDLLAERFGTLPCTAPDPKSIVVHGALIDLTTSGREQTRQRGRAPCSFDPDGEPFW